MGLLEKIFMIQLHQHALYISYDDGRMEPIDIRDLIQRLAADPLIASKSFQPWILEKVVESIFYHFREELQRDKIAFSELESLARTLLESFLLEAMPQSRGFFRLDLFDVAARYGTGFELEFYNEVKRFLFEKVQYSCGSERLPSYGQELTSLEPAKQPILQITGLRRCSKYLSGRRRWSKRSSKVRDEILAYIRQEAARAGTTELAIAVLS
jgi:hypothetical protein